MKRTIYCLKNGSQVLIIRIACSNSLLLETIAEIVYLAATGNADHLRYLAGDDAVVTYHHRLNVGPEEFRKGIATRLVG